MEGLMIALVMGYVFGCIISAAVYAEDAESFGEICARTLLWPIWLLRSMIRSVLKIWKHE